MTLEELHEMPVTEFQGWQEYFRRRPPGWKDDNRAAVIAMSIAGSNVRPEDLFDSLRVLKEETKPNLSQQFVQRFGHLMSKDADLSLLEKLNV